MKDLQIVITTDISPASTDLYKLLCSIEHLIETEYEGVCKAVAFHEKDHMITLDNTEEHY